MTGGEPKEKILAAARQVAAEQRHTFIGTEHLLAALLADPTSLASATVAAAGLDRAKVTEAILKGLRTAPAGQDVEPAVSRFAERALEAALGAAGAAGRTGLADEDLFRELLTRPKGRTAQAFKGDGTSLATIQEALGVGPPPAAPRPEGRPAEQPAEPGRKREKAAAGKAERKPARKERPPRSESDNPTPAPPGRGGPQRAAPEPAAIREERDDRPLRIAQPMAGPSFPWTRLLLAAIPVSIYLQLTHASPVATFVTACLGVLPLAGLMGEATESLADRAGPTIGGLLNATFGNAAELIIALLALRAGLVDLVKASITGSILGNLLLILGLSFVAGGLRKPVVRFNRTNAGMSAAMLALAVVGLVFPALFHAAHGPPNATAELYLSEAVAIILAFTYGLSLLFSLKTHKALFGGGDHPDVEPRWSTGWSVAVLGGATLGIVVLSEILVGTVESVSASLGLTQTFLGLIIIPLIGNAAEHATAVVVARKGQPDLALQIALGSSTQVALLVAPILVLAGLVLGAPMNLVFSPFEVLALAVSTAVIAIITLDGETHWFEGVQLLAVYGMVAAAAFFI